MKKTKVQCTPDGEAYLSLDDFADLVDISIVRKYTLESIQDAETGDTCLVLKFYDHKGRLVESKNGN